LSFVTTTGRSARIAMSKAMRIARFLLTGSLLFGTE
jgi:hypothetical protein